MSNKLNFQEEENEYIQGYIQGSDRPEKNTNEKILMLFLI